MALPSRSGVIALPLTCLLWGSAQYIYEYIRIVQAYSKADPRISEISQPEDRLGRTVVTTAGESYSTESMLQTLHDLTRPHTLILQEFLALIVKCHLSARRVDFVPRSSFSCRQRIESLAADILESACLCTLYTFWKDSGAHVEKEEGEEGPFERLRARNVSLSRRGKAASVH